MTQLKRIQKQKTSRLFKLDSSAFKNTIISLNTLPVMKLTDNIEERFCPNVSFSTENLKKPAFYKMIIFQACFVDMTSNI